MALPGCPEPRWHGESRDSRVGVPPGALAAERPPGPGPGRRRDGDRLDPMIRGAEPARGGPGRPQVQASSSPGPYWQTPVTGTVRSAIGLGAAPCQGRWQRPITPRRTPG
eukprot:768616-Hanusia_phi.AAC.2